MAFNVIYDANVFYPAPLRDLLLELASTGLFKARWTDDITEEWTRNLSVNRPDIADKIPSLTKLIDTCNPDSIIDNHKSLIPGLELKDPDDRHVLAAAITSGSQVIVTFNLRDFPTDYLEQYGIEAQNPDDFLMHQFELNEQLFLGVIKTILNRLKKPVKSFDEYLDTLERQRLVKITTKLRTFSGIF